jgi:hypothetical protein
MGTANDSMSFCHSHQSHGIIISTPHKPPHIAGKGSHLYRSHFKRNALNLYVMINVMINVINTTSKSTASASEYIRYSRIGHYRICQLSGFC